jgi:ribosomal protein L37E
MKENHLIENPERWLEQRKYDLINHLMRAFLASLDTSDVYAMGTTLKGLIESLNPPKLPCSRCGRLLSYFDYHLKQGYCDSCTTILLNEMEDECEAAK